MPLTDVKDSVPDRKSGVAAWGALAILCLLYVFAVVDRHIISILVTPLQQDLHTGDFGISLLMGPAFVIFYAICGLPMGWAVDHFSRRTIVFLSIVGWSIATCSCGLARNFTQLFASRIAVGVGEAALSPSAHSILADNFPPHRLSTAISVYTAAAYLGVAVAIFGGGAMVEAYALRPWSLTFPIIGEIRIWQFMFLLVGLPGLAVAFLAWLLPRRNRIPRGAQTSKTSPDSSFVRHLRRHPRAFLTVLGAAAANNMMVCAIVSWLPMCVVRTYGWSLKDAAFISALLVIGGGCGQVLAGPLIDKLEARGVKDAPLRFLMTMLVVVAVTGVCAPLMPSAQLFGVLMLVCNVCLYPCLGYLAAATQSITPSPLRGRASALYMLCISMIGAGIGPVWIGLLTEHLFEDQAKLYASLSLFIGLCAPLTFGLAWQGLKSFRMARESVGEISIQPAVEINIPREQLA